MFINSISIFSIGSSTERLFFISKTHSKVISFKVMLFNFALLTVMSGLFSSIKLLESSLAEFCNVSHDKIKIDINKIIIFFINSTT